MLGAVAAGHWSGSVYVANASRVVAIIWIGSLLLYLIGGDGVWRYALLELFALIYFYRRWASPEGQHRQFHFLLMASYLVTTALYSYEVAVRNLAPGALFLSQWWFMLASNILFAVELALIISYALLFRRAKADRAKYYSDVDGWFAKAGAAKRGAGAFLRRLLRGGKSL